MAIYGIEFSTVLVVITLEPPLHVGSPPRDHGPVMVQPWRFAHICARIFRGMESLQFFAQIPGEKGWWFHTMSD